MTERKEGEIWTVDAGVPLQSLLDDPKCPALLCRALSRIHSWQQRNETAVHRALQTTQLMPQWLAALLALGVVVIVEGDSSPERRPDAADGPVGGGVPLEDFLEHRTRGQVTALHIPLQSSRVGFGEASVGRTPADEPIVAAYSTVRLSAGAVEEARVALTGVWSGPAQLAEAPAALIGGPLSQERIQAVAAAVEDEVEPQGDYLGSVAYRRAMAGVLTRRALEACAAALAAAPAAPLAAPLTAGGER